MSGINVIMGCGYYIGELQSSAYDLKTEQQITDEIVKDIQIGVGPDRIKARIIGEIGCCWPLSERERKSLRASAVVQKKLAPQLVFTQAGTKTLLCKL